jgi:hypothetical protein
LAVGIPLGHDPAKQNDIFWCQDYILARLWVLDLSPKVGIVHLTQEIVNWIIHWRFDDLFRIPVLFSFSFSFFHFYFHFLLFITFAIEIYSILALEIEG